MPHPVPAEIQIGSIYLPPALVVGLLGLAVAWIAGQMLNWTRLARYFWNPPLAFLAMWALASALIGLTILSP